MMYEIVGASIEAGVGQDGKIHILDGSALCGEADDIVETDNSSMAIPESLMCEDCLTKAKEMYDEEIRELEETVLEANGWMYYNGDEDLVFTGDMLVYERIKENEEVNGVYSVKITITIPEKEVAEFNKKYRVSDKMKGYRKQLAKMKRARNGLNVQIKEVERLIMGGK